MWRFHLPQTRDGFVVFGASCALADLWFYCGCYCRRRRPRLLLIFIVYETLSIFRLAIRLEHRDRTEVFLMTVRLARMHLIRDLCDG
ncbi:hypothetical protein QL093DRAFT_2300580 [Fusarium oxysporum]|nr:hypothetical protein QL093DRAFT_2300580 [Fusarium oxysporum]